MPRANSIVAVTRLADGLFVAAATDRRTNSLWQFDGAAWSKLAEWKGAEITACCAVGEDLVCPALDGKLFIWSQGQIQQLALPTTTMWVYDAVALDEQRALLGGEGLVFVEPKTGGVIHRRLGDYGVSKPGRTIHGVCRSEGRTIIVGAKNMVLELKDDAVVELANRGTFGGRELFFRGAAVCNDRLWISGWTGSVGVLVALDAAGPKVYDDPIGPGKPSFGLRCHHGELIAYQDEIMIGGPGNWRPLFPGFKNGDGFVALEPSARNRWCAIAYNGQSWLLDGDSIQPVPVFRP
jgi:hypothetical protein